MSQKPSKEILNQVHKLLLPALAMLDLRGTDDKVTLAMMIAEKTLLEIYKGKKLTPELIYNSVIADFAQTQI